MRNEISVQFRIKQKDILRSPSIVMTVKSKRLQWAKYVTTRGTRNA